MFTTYRYVADRYRIFHPSDSLSTGCHILATDLSRLTENPDALVLYMSILWDKHSAIRWKPRRFNAALTWMVEHKIMALPTAIRYEREPSTEATRVRRHYNGAEL